MVRRDWMTVGVTALVIGLLAGAFVNGIAICPSNEPVRTECFAEARRIGLNAALLVGGVAACIGAVLIFLRTK